MQNRLLLICFLLFCSFIHLRAGDHPLGSLSGTYLVGSSQPTYKKLTDVASILNNNGFTVVGNVVFELDSDYDGTTGETFPITFNQFNSNGNWTVTIRPKAGVSLRTTAGNPGASALITLNGIDRLILDGRAGGAGGIAWLIRNTAATNAGATILLQNDAQNNTLTYLQMEGQTTSAGTVHIGTSGTDGNDNNTISYCAIRDRTDMPNPPRPVTGILSLGSEASTGNIFDHNNIFNFYNSGGSAYGIRLDQGTTGASITYNSIYQEQAMLNAVSGTRLYGISAGEWSTNRLTIADNFIGGSAPECGGAPLTLASAANSFCVVTGISYGFLNAPFGDQNICNHNTIRNIAVAVDQAAFNVPGIFTGIYIIARMDITNNTIGNPDGHDDIKITAGSGTYNFTASMIRHTANHPGFITGNRMGGITIGGRTSSGYGSELIGIYGTVGGGLTTSVPLVVSDNIIGSTTIPDNIRVIGDSLPINFSGIDFSMPIALSCINNTVAGVTLGYAGTTVQTRVYGINVFTAFSNLLVKNNLVSGISSASLNVVPTPEYDYMPLHELIGIYTRQGIGQGLTDVSGNTVRGLHLTGTTPINAAAGTNKGIAGIYMGGAANSMVYNNKVYDLSSANNLGASAATMLSGIDIEHFYSDIYPYSVTAYNNLVSLDNGGLSNNCEINGLQIEAASGPYVDKLYHNTIYIGGNSGTSSNTASSAPLTYSHGTLGSASFSIRNNLLVNGRTGGTGRHYLFRNVAGDHWTAASSDTNVLVTADVSKIGRWGTSDLDSTQWKTTGGDAHSSFYTVAQISPAALFRDAAAGDLRIKGSAGGYVTGKGTASTGITTDYAGQIRSTTAPTIGAYEGVAPNTAPVVTSHGGNTAVTLPVPENTTVVTTVTATDADGGSLVYSLAGGEDEGRFTINSSTGVLSFITAPDFEQPGDANSDNTYIVSVQISDGEATGTQRFKIKVTDANDHAPVIISYNGDFSVNLRLPENTTAIGTVKATDIDKNTTITYSLVNEEDAAKFTINSSTGVLSFITAPDFEQPGDTNGDNVYLVTVKASDGDSAATQRFKIKIQDVNDHGPVIISNNGKDTVKIQVAENTTTAIDTVTATDADAGATIRYSIVSGGDGSLFSVDPVTGALAFVSAPDYEQPADGNHDNIYIVTVQVSDGDSTDTQRFEIKVTNSNDSPLIITTTMQLPENTSVVTTLAASDDDAGITISILNEGDGALFSIAPATGALSFITAPDFEHPGDANGDNIYVVSIRMFDGTLATILRLNITITDTDGSAARPTGQPEVQQTVVLQMETAPEPGKGIKVYPNPVTGKRFSLRMDSVAAGRYTLELYTIAGQLACRQLLNHTGKSVIYPVQLPASLSRGVYIMKLTGVNTGYSERLIID